MEQLNTFLLGIWREASRHIEIGEFATTVAEMLARGMPLERLAIRKFDPERCSLDTLASASLRGEDLPAFETTPFAAKDLERLLRWCRAGKLMRRSTETRSEHLAYATIPPSLQRGMREMMIGPLVSEHGATGVALLQARPNQHFNAAHEHLGQALLEPCAVALDNDQRLSELFALREVAEADKRSLLTRLGREDLSVHVVGAEKGLHSVMERVALVARSDVPVLILGETGSGKEVIARTIHNRSLRAQRPFIRVNCGAIPPELIDSELFGHEKGSFTGAAATRRGWFERADTGTLFLDEIGELPLAAQVRLLRVLQDGSFERVGGERPMKSDVRLVAATHRDLAAMVQNSAFREDLWYRISVFPIVLPPLRERLEDIPPLAEHFARRAALRFGLKLQLPSAEQIALLTTYLWPGNVRELGTVIDRAAILGDGTRLEISRSLGVGLNVAVPQKTANGQHAVPTDAPSALLSLDDLVKRHLERALSTTQGRIEGPHGVAALLKINPHTLRARMRKLGIEWGQFRSHATPTERSRRAG